MKSETQNIIESNSSMNNSNPLPETGFVRLKQILGDPKADPPIPAVIPVSKSTWWSGVKDGRFPKPVKLSARITVWRVEDVRALIDPEGCHAT